MTSNLAVIDPEKCTACGACIGQCPTGAILGSPAVRLTVKETAQ
jgi:NAD-dependent dihydropyrimidine dehydrogenase PreA subunit